MLQEIIILAGWEKSDDVINLQNVWPMVDIDLLRIWKSNVEFDIFR